MALDTYANLQTEIIGWLHRSDLAANIPTFITLCETKFNRNLRISTMESRVTSTVDEQYESLPSDFLEMRSIQITGTDGRALEYITPNVMNQRYRAANTGIPKFFTIIDNTIEFGSPPDASYSMEMVYYKAIPALSDSNTTNWMLDNHPDVYLYGSLLSAEAFLKNDKRIPLWRQSYGESIEEIRGADQNARHSGPLTMKVVNHIGAL